MSESVKLANGKYIDDKSLIHSKSGTRTNVYQYLENLNTNITNATTNITNLNTNKANTKKVWNVSTTTTWIGDAAPYYQDVTVSGLTASDIINVYPVWSTTLETRTNQRSNYSKISYVDSMAGKMRLYCDEEAPTLALDLRVEVTY